MEINEITDAIIGAAIAVHKVLGPGLLESTYEACLIYELRERDLDVKAQVPVPVEYKGVRLECGYRLDILVEDEVLVEIKAVAKPEPIHKAQVLTYLRLTGLHAGLLINFNEELLKSGIRRLVHNLKE